MLPSDRRPHLLNDLAAQGDVGAAEHVSHVPRHLQVILSIHPGDLQRRAILRVWDQPAQGFTDPPERDRRSEQASAPSSCTATPCPNTQPMRAVHQRARDGHVTSHMDQGHGAASPSARQLHAASTSPGAGPQRSQGARRALAPAWPECRGPESGQTGKPAVTPCPGEKPLCCLERQQQLWPHAVRVSGGAKPGEPGTGTD